MYQILFRLCEPFPIIFRETMSWVLDKEIYAFPQDNVEQQ